MSGDTAGQDGAGLRRDAIRLREVLFQSITAMAPAAAVAASIPAGAAFAGESLPLSVLIALVVGYFLHRRREAFKPVRHLLLPVLGIAAFVPALLTAAGLPVFDFVSELTAPVSYAGSVVGVWMAAGVVVLVVLIRRHPGRMADTARVRLDDPSPTGLPQNGAVQR